ncbi:MAG: cytochrome c family protein [Desulfuromonadales bacterium]|nr:cytochrome c family protein [Desulfuromonadales bacterium]
MKRIIAAFAITMFAATSVMAADVMTFHARNGDVTFDHKKHQETLKDCAICHGPGTPGVIADFGKDFAHGKGCKGCHQEKGQGPTKCGECHKR